MLKNRGVRLGLLVLVGFTILLTAFGLWQFGNWIGFFMVYSWILNNLTSYGMNTHIATILAVILGLGIWAGAIYLWHKNRRWGIVIIAFLMILQATFPLILERDRYFSAKSGEPIRYYTINPLTREIQVFDRPIYDAFGQKALPVTFEVAERLERQRLSDKFPNEEVLADRIKYFFDPYTGAPLVYYSQDGAGEIHLYIRDGYDIKSGVKLQPVTITIVNRALAQNVISSTSPAYSIRPPSQSSDEPAIAVDAKGRVLPEEQQPKELRERYGRGSKHNYKHQY